MNFRIAARFWTAPVLWRYSYHAKIESGRGLPHSKTLPRLHKPLFNALGWEPASIAAVPSPD
jgi:hypothetical protein